MAWLQLGSFYRRKCAGRAVSFRLRAAISARSKKVVVER